MKVQNVSVKSKEQVVDNVDVEEFESYPEAVEFFTSVDAEGKTLTDGDAITLGFINKMHRTNKCNVARQNATQTAKSGFAALRRAAKADPAVAERLQDLLGDLGLDNVKI